MTGPGRASDRDRCAGCMGPARKIGAHSLPLCGICEVVEEVAQEKILVYVSVYRKGGSSRRWMRLVLAVRNAA
jgi:hypothetical protein